MESISTQLARLKTQAIGFTLGNLAITNLSQTVDEYKSYESRINLISKSNAQAKGTFSELMQIANETGSAFGATAELYTRLYRAMGNQANSAEIIAIYPHYPTNDGKFLAQAAKKQKPLSSS